MRYIVAIFLLASLAFAAGSPNTLTAEEEREGYELLFNGKDLTGWEGDREVWKVADGAIVGSSDNKKLTENTFLITKEEFSDFILEADVRLRNHNSGIQFRSEALPNWVVRGYQADMADGKWWGSLYGEKTDRGVIVNGWEGKAENVVKKGDWNHYEIYCKGDHIKLSVNGLVTADTHDDMASKGIIALQLHRGPPMQVEFRNIKIKRLD